MKRPRWFSFRLLRELIDHVAKRFRVAHLAAIIARCCKRQIAASSTSQPRNSVRAARASRARTPKAAHGARAHELQQRGQILREWVKTHGESPPGHKSPLACGTRPNPATVDRALQGCGPEYFRGRELPTSSSETAGRSLLFDPPRLMEG